MARPRDARAARDTKHAVAARRPPSAGARLPAAARRQQELATVLAALPAAEVARVEREITLASAARDVTYLNEPGKAVVIRLLPVPVVLARADLVYLRRVLGVLTGAFRKVTAARDLDAEVQELLPLTAAEEEWLRFAPRNAGPVCARWDMNIDPAAGARAATLFEMNGCAVGGLHYAHSSSEIVLDTAVARVGGRSVTLPDGMGALWHSLALRHAGARGRCGVAWLEDRTWETGITEGPSVMASLGGEAAGALVADPRELEVHGDKIRCRGVTLDVLYRSIELADLVEIEATEGRPLVAMREAVRRGLVLSPLEGDLDHKSLLELFSSSRFARLFTAAERAVMRRHVPWTRLLGARRTEGPDGREVDLPAYAVRHRSKLVFKPNRSCGGDGILIGRDTKPITWERAIARAVLGREPAVVQSLVASASVLSPTVKRGKVVVERHYTTFGFFPTDDGIGVLGRAAPFPVVNVSRGGGLLAVLAL
ncbi:MAG: hypothetical protein EXR73_01420 [Myxococcales bacterium]|nr:hypothetical protein [Myxococcales bacterium]